MDSIRFAIHRTDLARRRERCRAAVESVRRLETEVVGNCNLCGCEQRAIISLRDRYGCPVRTAFCLHCGLIYVVDRLTHPSYEAFYEQGLYRDLIGSFKGMEQSVDMLLRSQRYYATRLVSALSGLLPSPAGRLLDAGGSTGLVASEFAKRFGYSPVLFDPSPKEVEAARELGIEAHVGTLETFRTDEQFDLVLLCRTVEHLYDLRGALLNLRSLVRPGGLLYCDFSDYMEVCRREGPPEATSKIDHCYWMIQELAPEMFRSLGLEVVALNVTMSPEQVGFLLTPCLPAAPVPPSEAWIHRQIRKLRQLETTWERSSQEPLDMRDWLKVRAYRAKIRLFGDI